MPPSIVLMLFAYAKICSVYVSAVLHRHLDVDAVALGMRRDDWVQRILFLVQPLDERDDAALESVVSFAQLLAALVAQGNRQAAIEERQFAKALLQDVPVKVDHFEHRRVGLEPLHGSAASDALATFLSFCTVAPRTNFIS